MGLQVVGTVFFGLALLHTFSAPLLNRWAGRFPEGTVAENALHLMGEVEVVFGLWAGIYIAYLFAVGDQAQGYVRSLDFTEPLFVFAIMAMAAKIGRASCRERVLAGV